MNITNSNNKRFDEIMNDWLWNERDYNPFLKYMAELGRSLPEVNNVEGYDNTDTRDNKHIA